MTYKELTEGMKVVVKGNERIRDGQDIAVADTAKNKKPLK